jgi:UPF0755 protein
MTQKIQLSTIGIVIVTGVVFFLFAVSTPKAFPQQLQFQVHEGESLYSISERLENEHVIHSALMFRGWISLLGYDKDIGLGEYDFTSRAPLGIIIAKFIQGPDKPLLSVTIPEGHTTQEIAEAFKKAIPTLSVSTFEKLVRDEDANGYLFPSTYYPLPSFTEKDIIASMRATFEKEYAKHFKDESFPVMVPSQKAVLSLAAILEGEAKTPEDMKIVSGILQKRLSNGMRLQVDVARSTYEKSGLPEQPINNPGIVAMQAVFNPVTTPYLYYITGRDGKMYYAKTFEDHKKNIQRHL